MEYEQQLDVDEQQFDIEDAGFYEEIEDEEEEFDKEYEQIFADESDTEVEEDVEMIEKELITGKRMRKPRMSILNKTKISSREMDDLFLD